MPLGNFILKKSSKIFQLPTILLLFLFFSQNCCLIMTHSPHWLWPFVNVHGLPCFHFHCGNKYPNEKKQTLLILPPLTRTRLPNSGVGKLYTEKNKGRLRVCPGKLEISGVSAVCVPWEQILIQRGLKPGTPLWASQLGSISLRGCSLWEEAVPLGSGAHQEKMRAVIWYEPRPTAVGVGSRAWGRLGWTPAPPSKVSVTAIGTVIRL